MSDQELMRRALQLAERGRGYVEPNPLVGAVIVREGAIVGEGWHPKYGQDHAEIVALKQAGELAQGSTLYVTLEPCCHQGKTPPCTEAVIRAGIKRVVAAMADPFAAVAGKGFQKLRETGIETQSGLLEKEARFLNRPYLKRLRTDKPYIHAKWAMSLDGKIATSTGESKWITGEIARQKVHHYRGLMDGIITGRGTLLSDDPLLTARPPGPRTPTRIVLSQGKTELPTNCQLLKSVQWAPVLLAVHQDYLFRHEAWRNAGAELLGYQSLEDFLKKLAERGMTNIWLEAGTSLLGSFLDSREIDEVHCFIAPRIIGGKHAHGPISGIGIAHLPEAMKCDKTTSELLGEDFYIRGWMDS
ncbi:bifunctional diaminohydroxyphosphoribosylaminopyrimidine deaminase/5-amino-6-(5-phosphoribosylamino)uracil reductase RibD [Telmatocola sphagniphila]|uniref:Riboflavin biosynthesis protein RibD n=1 Tax=Telmatocola sphagniphila TaxID=1123043 RepID=A0A8E6B3W7_9BACT|nr:bifunctional diaminohydroxyphosphoribosylaminopyrimidine deaminase/5-amino-6-(5-phosphoribosylamino)uracil reductase RibD [Telmatocola sphagniphila]QVL29900.1 bifunctional diaminohydroxyphosphoribosylaminopyrimidine deaminase/5-amino-6-(5-phosphoribosylamino)uracil reductase RibD [Telmatocola sphagniphila]